MSEETKETKSEHSENQYEGFLPSEVSPNGLLELAKFIEEQGRITPEELEYFQKTAQLTQSYQNQLESSRNKIQQASQILSAPDQPPQQVNLMELFQLFSAMQQPEAPKSFLMKKGDEQEIKEFKEREENAKKSQLLGTSSKISEKSLSKDEMERARRERYEALQKKQEEAAREREENLRKTKAREAFFKNEGNPSYSKR